MSKNDAERRDALWRELAFTVERTQDTAEICAAAARQLTWSCFQSGDLAEGLKALATNVKSEELPTYVMHPSHGRLASIVAELHP